MYAHDLATVTKLHVQIFYRPDVAEYKTDNPFLQLETSYLLVAAFVSCPCSWLASLSSVLDG
jgi:hypothetical protein